MPISKIINTLGHICVDNIQLNVKLKYILKSKNIIFFLYDFDWNLLFLFIFNNLNLNYDFFNIF